MLDYLILSYPARHACLTVAADHSKVITVYLVNHATHTKIPNIELHAYIMKSLKN